MIWLWSLLILGMFSARGLADNGSSNTTPSTNLKTDSSTTPKLETTTQDLITKLDADATNKLLNILNSCEGKSNGNIEFSRWITKIREVSQGGKDRLNDKIAIRILFESYNIQRLDLEQKIHDRIDDLDFLIADQERDSSCSKFYQQQKYRLEKALKLDNSKKEIKLKENSITCPESDDYDEDCDIFEDYEW
ncbi:uncharacterized protein LOC108161550 [Drosophila miranda]|uniref:uncharacterized protein LOC108161550 n=1 Tax=Drosophila miranda TaxID=7229 RepID=UPI0007E81227|nr:uncharacterized protein LOC108161550 [Drosophila miranda]